MSSDRTVFRESLPVALGILLAGAAVLCLWLAVLWVQHATEASAPGGSVDYVVPAEPY